MCAMFWDPEYALTEGGVGYLAVTGAAALPVSDIESGEPVRPSVSALGGAAVRLVGALTGSPAARPARRMQDVAAPPSAFGGCPVTPSASPSGQPPRPDALPPFYDPCDLYPGCGCNPPGWRCAPPVGLS